MILTERVKNIRTAMGLCPYCGNDHRAHVMATAAFNGLRLLPLA